MAFFHFAMTLLVATSSPIGRSDPIYLERIDIRSSAFVHSSSKSVNKILLQRASNFGPLLLLVSLELFLVFCGLGDLPFYTRGEPPGGAGGLGDVQERQLDPPGDQR
jgi:hypothetical protein